MRVADTEIEGLPAWAEVSLDAVSANVVTMRSLLAPGTRLMAVVKGDGYGCGAVEVARAALESGADMLGVTHLAEGLELRRSGVDAPILLFRPLLSSEVGEALDYDLTVTVASLHDLKVLATALSGTGKVLKAHLKIETGLGRLGLRPGPELAEAATWLREYPEIQVEGVYSHLATAAWGSRSFAWRQFARLVRAAEQLQAAGFSGLVRHLCNSAATVRFPEMHLDMVRVGSGLYGPLAGLGRTRQGRTLDLRPAWQARCRVLEVYDVPAGTTVGYGRDYLVRRPTRLAVLPVGYADGFGVGPDPHPRGWFDFLLVVVKLFLVMFGRPAGPVKVWAGGRPVRVAGRVGMQLTVVDVGREETVRPGTVVNLGIRHTVAGPRLPRIYLRRGEVVGITAGGKILPTDTVKQTGSFCHR